MDQCCLESRVVGQAMVHRVLKHRSAASPHLLLDNYGFPLISATMFSLICGVDGQALVHRVFMHRSAASPHLLGNSLTHSFALSRAPRCASGREPSILSFAQLAPAGRNHEWWFAVRKTESRIARGWTRFLALSLIPCWCYSTAIRLLFSSGRRD